MGYNLFQRLRGAAPRAFAATVAALPPGADDPDTAAPDSAVPDVMIDFGLDVAPDNGAVAARPTLSHIGRYALKQRLADGGLGTVYEAWDPLLSRTVAVKTLQFDVETPLRVSLDGLFLNEARTAAGLNHRHIVTVFDAGLSPHGVYIAMERLYGRDMRQALAAGWLPTPERAAQLARRVADALAYAHARGVVHCDIKPANIFLTRRCRPKVLDFGIARAAHGADAPILDGLVAGSPHYLAPEQLRGEGIDARTDVYGLGVVFYELLTGRKAFDGGSLDAIASAVFEGAPIPAHVLRPGLPRELSAIAARAMARRREDRHASAADFSQDLRGWIEKRAVAPDAASPMQARAESPARSRWRWAPATMAVAIPIGMAALAAFGSGREAAGMAASTPPPAAAAADIVTATAAPPTVAPAEPAADERSAPVVISAARIRPRAPAAAQARVAALPARSAVAGAVGVLQIAVSPWGHIEVDGAAVGITPPMTRLSLPEGMHQVTVRNEDFVPYTATVQVSADKPAVVRHRFGS